MRSDHRRARGCRFFSQGEADSIEKPLRAQYISLFSKAAEAGESGTDNLFDLTPREIAWRFEAIASRARARDEQAWMTARYVALAVHAPEKLPPHPVFLCAPQKEMSDTEMKLRLLTWAEKEAT